MKNIILAILFVFSIVWSHDVSARASKSKKKPSVTQKKNVAKNKKKAKVKREVASDGSYRSEYLRKKRAKKGNRSVASVSSKKLKKDKHATGKKSKKRKHNY